MGRTSKPLYIVIGGQAGSWEEFDALASQGHIIKHLETDEINWPEVDVVLFEKAWRMDDLTRKYLGVALKEARMLRYSGPGPRASKKNRADAVAEIGPLPEAEHFPGGKYDPDRKVEDDDIPF